MGDGQAPGWAGRAHVSCHLVPPAAAADAAVASSFGQHAITAEALGVCHLAGCQQVKPPQPPREQGSGVPTNTANLVSLNVGFLGRLLGLSLRTEEAKICCCSSLQRPLSPSCSITRQCRDIKQRVDRPHAAAEPLPQESWLLAATYCSPTPSWLGQCSGRARPLPAPNSRLVTTNERPPTHSQGRCSWLWPAPPPAAARQAASPPATPPAAALPAAVRAAAIPRPGRPLRPGLWPGGC